MTTSAAAAALQARYAALPVADQATLVQALCTLGAFLLPSGTPTPTAPPLAFAPPAPTPPPAPTRTRAQPLNYSGSRPVSCQVTIVQVPRKPTPGLSVGQTMQLHGHENVSGPKGGRYTLLTGSTPLGPASFKIALRDYEVLARGGTAEAWCVLDATPGASTILGAIGEFTRR